MGPFDRLWLTKPAKPNSYRRLMKQRAKSEQISVRRAKRRHAAEQRRFR